MCISAAVWAAGAEVPLAAGAFSGTFSGASLTLSLWSFLPFFAIFSPPSHPKRVNRTIRSNSLRRHRRPQDQLRLLLWIGIFNHGQGIVFRARPNGAKGNVVNLRDAERPQSHVLVSKQKIRAVGRELHISVAAVSVDRVNRNIRFIAFAVEEVHIARAFVAGQAGHGEQGSTVPSQTGEGGRAGVFAKSEMWIRELQLNRRVRDAAIHRNDLDDISMLACSCRAACDHG